MESAESDDNGIYFGPITLKEIKKMFAVPASIPAGKLYKNENHNITKDAGTCEEEPDASFCLIKCRSQPNLRLAAENPCAPSKYDSPAGKSDDSFIQMENLVSKLCMSPKTSDNEELNNTFDVIDYILNHPPIKEVSDMKDVKIKKEESPKSSSVHESSEEQHTHAMKTTSKEICQLQSAYLIDNKQSPEAHTSVLEHAEIIEHTPLKLPLKVKVDYKKSPNYLTPAECVTKMLQPAALTPRVVTKTPILRTPANPSALKRPTSTRNTPSKINSYKHIASPVAAYIKNCPQVALMTNVRPKKPLPGMSGIPKLVKARSQENLQMGNKHPNMNFNLPSVAYKSAKKTKVIQVPDENKLPQSQWAKKIITSFPRPTVMKHEGRINPVKTVIQSNQENSFANLSCYQAEVSVCTEKCAFKPTNK